MLVADSQLRDLFLEKKVMDAQSIAELYSFARNAHIPLAQAAIEKGAISDLTLGKITADFLKIPFVEASKTNIPTGIFHLIPEAVARRHKTIVFGKDDTHISLATSYPDNVELFQMLEKKTSKKIKIYYATEADIDATIQMYRKDLQKA